MRVDSVQMTIRRPVQSLIGTAPHVENLGCERTRVVRWRIHKYLLCLEIGLSQNIFHVLRYFGWCAVISIECGFHRHPFGFPAGLGYVRSGRKDVLIHLAADSCFASTRSEEHTSELPSLMRNSYAVFCLKKKKN